MYTTPQEVMAVTPYTDITMDDVKQAQFVIEIYTGRTENQVSNSRDKAILARAVAAQAIYQKENKDVIFEQVKVGSVSRGDEGQAFTDDYSPFIAPLAAMACNSLSWWNSRSVRIGRSFQNRAGSWRERWITE